MTEIQKRLFALKDENYKKFNSSLIPTVNPETVIGVRQPELRKLAKTLLKEAEKNEEIRVELEKFLATLPHEYYEENNLHSFIIETEKDFDVCMKKTERFLPYIDNWATCDCFSPKVFGKSAENKAKLLVKIEEWLKSEKTYTIRYGIGMLMRWFLDEDFRPEFLEKVAGADIPTKKVPEKASDDYYIKMMIAWYFATALAKQPDATLPFLKTCALSEWTMRKTAQKARESFRVSDEIKSCVRDSRGVSRKAMKR